jgi:hypothetical protein
MVDAVLSDGAVNVPRAGIFVTGNRVLGTRWVVFSAWEALSPDVGFWSHSVQHTFDGMRMGQVGRRRLPDDLAVMSPFSEERIAAVKSWHAAEYARAYEAIYAQFPALRLERSLQIGMGEIEASHLSWGDF